MTAFVHSAAGTLSLHNGSENSTPYDPLEALLIQWRITTAVKLPEMQLRARKNRPLLEGIVKEMSTSLPNAMDQARPRAVLAPHAGHWLQALSAANNYWSQCMVITAFHVSKDLAGSKI